MYMKEDGVGFLSAYLTDVQALVQALDQAQVKRLVDLLEKAWQGGNRVLLMGNGGSSSTASHLVNDFQKCVQLQTGRAMKAMCLSDCTPLVMAWANDTDYSNVFAPQVECWTEPGDLIIAISGSGNSPNVLRAVEAGNRLGATTFGMAGFSGGKLAGICTECLVVRSDSMQRIEDIHLIVLHAVFATLLDRFESNGIRP